MDLRVRKPLQRGNQAAQVVVVRVRDDDVVDEAVGMIEDQIEARKRSLPVQIGVHPHVEQQPDLAQFYVVATGSDFFGPSKRDKLHAVCSDQV